MRYLCGSDLTLLVPIEHIQIQSKNKIRTVIVTDVIAQVVALVASATTVEALLLMGV